MTNFIIYQRFRYFTFYAISVLLASITISLCLFFIFLVVFNSFFTIPVVIEHARQKLALAIPAIPTSCYR